MKEALFYKKLKENTVQCQLCPHFCVLKPGERGKCRVRENQDGELVSLVYAKPCAVAIDPIEKKPIFHFQPGTRSYSIGTAGCNLACKFCQNWTTAQVRPEKVRYFDMEPEKLVEEAIKSNCSSIAYTYNEPTIYYEYVLDTAKLAREKGLKNVMVTNGFINPEPLKKLYPYIDAANIDLKAFTEDYYKDVCGAKLAPVLEAIKLIKEIGTWVEITNLVIPTLNNDLEKIKEMCKWIIDNLGKETPFHFSAFYPAYKLLDIPRTPPEFLEKARQEAMKLGLKYVYVGNVVTKSSNTYCPKCKKLVIERVLYTTNNLTDKGKCKECGYQIEGVW